MSSLFRFSLLALVLAGAPAFANTPADLPPIAIPNPATTLNMPKQLYDICHEGKGEPAIDACTTIIKHLAATDPWLPVIYIDRADAYADMAQNQLALADLGQVLILDPKNVYALALKGWLESVEGQSDQGVQDITAAIAIKPDTALLLAARGEIYRRARKLDLALADFTAAIAIDPNDFYAVFSRALAYSDLRQNETAIAEFTRALVLKPDSSAAYNDRGLVKHHMGQEQAAIEDFDNALRVRPDDQLAYLNRGLANVSLKRYGDAVHDFSEAVRLKPDYVSALNARVSANLSLAKLDTVFADLDHVIALDPNNAVAHNNRCLARGLAVQALDGALDDCALSIKLQPGKAFGYGARAIVQYRLGKFVEAIADCDTAMTFTSHDPYTLYIRGLAHLRNGDKDAGEADLAAARAADPDVAVFYARFGLTP